MMNRYIWGNKNYLDLLSNLIIYFSLLQVIILFLFPMKYISRPRHTPLTTYMWSFVDIVFPQQYVFPQQPVFVLFFLIGIFSLIVQNRNFFKDHKSKFIIIGIQGQLLFFFRPILGLLWDLVSSSYIIGFSISYTDYFWIIWIISIIILVFALTILYMYRNSEDYKKENDFYILFFVFNIFFIGIPYKFIFLTGYLEAESYIFIFIIVLIVLSKIYSVAFMNSDLNKFEIFILNAYLILSWALMEISFGGLFLYMGYFFSSPLFWFLFMFYLILLVSNLIGLWIAKKKKY